MVGRPGDRAERRGDRPCGASRRAQPVQNPDGIRAEGRHRRRMPSGLSRRRLRRRGRRRPRRRSPSPRARWERGVGDHVPKISTISRRSNPCSSARGCASSGISAASAWRPPSASRSATCAGPARHGPNVTEAELAEHAVDRASLVRDPAAVETLTHRWRRGAAAMTARRHLDRQDGEGVRRPHHPFDDQRRVGTRTAAREIGELLADYHRSTARPSTSGRTPTSSPRCAPRAGAS
jgi:hypothetical protein